MKNSQKGFVVPLLVGIIALLVIGGGVYIYENKKVETPVVVDNTVQQSNQVQQPIVQNNPVNSPAQNTQTPPPKVVPVFPIRIIVFPRQERHTCPLSLSKMHRE